jgi:transcriptional regulator with XRE-family HTH domain
MTGDARRRFPIPSRLHTALRAAGFVRRKDAAEHLGISPSYLADLLAGRRRPNLDLAVRLDEEYAIPVREWALPRDP